MLRYLLIALLILLGLSSLGSAIFGRQARRRLALAAFTVIVWGAAAFIYLNPTVAAPRLSQEPTVALTPTATPAPTATPQPGRILWHAGPSDNLQLWIMDDDGSNQRQLTAGEAIGTNVEPAWSPD